MEKEEEEIFEIMTKLHFSILDLYKRERLSRAGSTKIAKMIEEIKRRKAQIPRIPLLSPENIYEDKSKSLIQENIALRTELNKALVRIQDLERIAAKKEGTLSTTEGES